MKKQKHTDLMAYRKALGYTQVQAYTSLNIPKPTWQSWEYQTRRTPDLAYIAITMHWLLSLMHQSMKNYPAVTRQFFAEEKQAINDILRGRLPDVLE